MQGAQQIVSTLRTQLEAVQQELAEKTASETVNRTISGLQADLQAAEQQARQAGGHTAADLQMQLDWADGNTQCLQEVSTYISCHSHATIRFTLTSCFYDHI